MVMLWGLMCYMHELAFELILQIPVIWEVMGPSNGMCNSMIESAKEIISLSNWTVGIRVQKVFIRGYEFVLYLLMIMILACFSLSLIKYLHAFQSNCIVMVALKTHTNQHNKIMFIFHGNAMHQPNWSRNLWIQRWLTVGVECRHKLENCVRLYGIPVVFMEGDRLSLMTESHWKCQVKLQSQQSLNVNILRARQNDHQFAEGIFKCIFLNESALISL